MIDLVFSLLRMCVSLFEHVKFCCFFSMREYIQGFSHVHNMYK